MTNNSYIPFNTFGLNRFQLIIPRCPMLSFLAQQITIPDQSNEAGDFSTRKQKIEFPSEYLQFGELQVTANLDEFWLAYEEVNAWQRGVSMPYAGHDWGKIVGYFDSSGMPPWLLKAIPDLSFTDNTFANTFSTASIMLKTSHNTSFAELNIEYIWPKNITHQDLQTSTSQGMEPNAFSVTFAVHEVDFTRHSLPWD